MNNVMIVTGTRKGIGMHIAKHYLKEKCLVAGCSRKEAAIEHEHYHHYKLDVSNEKAVVAMVKDVRSFAGRIDVLINNAGIGSMNHLLLTPAVTVKKVFNTNYFGSFLFLREAAKVMVKQRYGRIINFSSIAAPIRLEGEAVYASSKLAVECLTQIAAKELGEFGITVNAIGPTPIETDLTRNIPEGKIQALLGRQTFKRLGTFEDIINVLDFFIDKKSGFVTGQVIYLGGING